MEHRILAVVTLDKSRVGGGAPIFVAADREEQEKVALFIARPLNAMVHDLENGSYIIVKH